MRITFGSEQCRVRAAVCRAGVVAALSVLPSLVPAQTLPMSGPQRATRAELASRVAELEVTLANPQLKKEVRLRDQLELTAIRNRLSNGDFRVGDRFLVTIRRDSSQVDTASVRDSLKVSIFSFPDISLAGVLRAELDARMEAHVARFLRNASVRTNVLTRIAVLGAVRVPGYYYLSPDRPVSDVVMLAGGPTAEANLKQLEISREGKVVVRAKDSDRLLKEGRTLEQLDVQSGDEVRIPEKRKVNWQLVVQLFLILSSLLFAFISFLQWYYNRQNS